MSKLINSASVGFMHYIRPRFKNIFFLWFCLFFQETISPFDVKVLLRRSLIQDCVKTPIVLDSEHGFILSHHAKLSTGYEYKGRALKVSSQYGTLCLNDKPLQDKLIYISPMLSHAHQIQLKSHISCWLETCKTELYQLTEPLHELFDEMVSSDDIVDAARYEAINLYAQEVCTVFIGDLLQDLTEDSSVTAQTLQDYANDFLGQKAQNAFVAQLADKHLTSAYRKMLHKDKNKRYLFFNQELYEVVSKLLCEYVLALPRKLLQQILNEPIGAIEYEGNKYLGSFILFQDKKQQYLINSLDIDDYLLSVIKHEGWPGWPIEMNKVLAIACRTYLIWQVLQAQKLDRPYHIENGIKHQTYKGYHPCPKLKQAIDETKDLFVAYDGKPALTMYDACCGGIVPGNIDDPDYKRVSYLARMYPCTFCKSYKVYHWSLDFSGDEIVKKLRKEFPKIEHINDIHVYKKDKAGLVKKIMIVAGSRKIIITEKKMKSLFPELKSYCFGITKAHRRYMIEGKGFGHHRGLCQWGACHLVKHEYWNFKEVLQFYYPGTTLMKLTYQR